MTYREKIDWLHRYRDSVARYRVLQQERAQLRALAEGVSRGMAPPGGDSRHDALPAAVERIAAAEDSLAAQVDICLQIRAEVEAVIARVKEPVQREVLRRRYLLCQKFEVIAGQMQLDLRWVYRLHRRAVQNLPLPEIDQ